MIKKQINTLKDFYSLMFLTRDIRMKLVKDYIKSFYIDKNLIDELKIALKMLEMLPRQTDGRYRLQLVKDKYIFLDLYYEINELKKDIFFLTHDEKDFLAFLSSMHHGFTQQLTKGKDFLSKIKIKTFVTDRDGTINNYCGRYLSSIQSVYNAVFLSRFAMNSVDNAIILTSAPLDNIGLKDVSIMPEGIFIYAGSKGREYFDKKLIRHVFPIEKEKQQMLAKLNERLKLLVRQPEYEIFSLIGSGLQFKFGQTTIARQDISGTIPENDSLKFLNIIKHIVSEIDPEGIFFRIEDTGKDIEIILTIDNNQQNQGLKDFDKGDGIVFLDMDLGLNMSDGITLVCGDTLSDFPMIEVAINRSGATRAIFVTEDVFLKEKIISLLGEKNVFFVNQSDILISILNE